MLCEITVNKLERCTKYKRYFLPLILNGCLDIYIIYILYVYMCG